MGEAWVMMFSGKAVTSHIDAVAAAKEASDIPSIKVVFGAANRGDKQAEDLMAELNKWAKDHVYEPQHQDKAIAIATLPGHPGRPMTDMDHFLWDLLDEPDNKLTAKSKATITKYLQSRGWKKPAAIVIAGTGLATVAAGSLIAKALSEHHNGTTTAALP